MKTFLIVIALIGYSLGAYAQDKRDCTPKTTGHKVAMKHHRAKNNFLPAYIVVLAPSFNDNASPVSAAASDMCYTYTKDNIVVEECPATIYPDGNFDFSTDHVYLGYYPQVKPAQSDNAEAPQHTVINNYRGIAPADGNSCTGCSAW